MSTSGALDDPRLALKIEDGFAFVRSTTEHASTLIVLDLTDPGGPSAPLYTADFYRACAARLKPAGAMTLHIASPVAHPDAHPRGARERCGRRFAIVTPYLTSHAALRRAVDDGVLLGRVSIPACPSPPTVDRRIAAARLRDLQYYNGDMHRAALALPNFVRALTGP